MNRIRGKVLKVGEIFKDYVRVMRIRNVTVSIISYFMTAFKGSFLGWYLPIKLSEVIGKRGVGFLYSIVKPIYALFSVPAGILADIVGRRIVAIVGTSIGVAADLCLLSTRTLPLTVILTWVSISFTGNSIPFLYYEACSRDDRSLVRSMITFFSMVGASLGSILLPFVLERKGYVQASLICILLCFLALLVRLFFKETYTRAHSKALTFRKFIKTAYSKLKGGLRACFSRSLLPFTCLFPLFAFTSAMLSAYISIYYREVLGFSLSSIGIALSITEVIRTMTSFLYGPLSRRVGLVLLSLGGTGLAILSFVLLLNKLSFIQFLIALGLGAVSEITVGISCNVLFMNALDQYQQLKASINSSMYSIVLISSTIAPTIGGILWNTKPQAILLVGILLHAFALPFIVRLKKYE